MSSEVLAEVTGAWPENRAWLHGLPSGSWFDSSTGLVHASASNLGSVGMSAGMLSLSALFNIQTSLMETWPV